MFAAPELLSITEQRSLLVRWLRKRVRKRERAAVAEAATEAEPEPELG